MSLVTQTSELCTLQLLRQPSGGNWPPLADWLTPEELTELSMLRAAQRRRDWLSGRWCVKTLLAGRTDQFLAWTIRSRCRQMKGRRPQAWKDGITQCLKLSISHCETLAAAAMSHGTQVGLDLVSHSTPIQSFAETWFTRAELRVTKQAAISELEAWAAKEAAFKACNEGESFRPLQCEVISAQQHCCRVLYRAVTPAKLATVRLLRRAQETIAIAACVALRCEISETSLGTIGAPR